MWGVFVNIYDKYYNKIAVRCGTDIDGAKFLLRRYIANLKLSIDDSDDEYKKRLWREEFGEDVYPTTDNFLTTIFIYGKNPFTFKE